MFSMYYINLRSIDVWAYLNGSMIAGFIPVLYALSVAWRVRKTHRQPLQYTLLWFGPEMVVWFYLMFLFRPYPLTGPMNFFT